MVKVTDFIDRLTTVSICVSALHRVSETSQVLLAGVSSVFFSEVSSLFAPSDWSFSLTRYFSCPIVLAASGFS